ncbi:UDP-N-acetylmuramoylalanine-D-glutamate ligase [Bradyrhizobium sp. JR3.5]
MTISSDPRQWQVGMLGYGEVGRILAEDLRKRDVKVAAYDIKLDREEGAPLRAHAAETGVALAQSHTDLATRGIRRVPCRRAMRYCSVNSFGLEALP